MKTRLSIPVLAFLLIALPSPCFAMMEIWDLSKEQAKAFGVVLRASKNGMAGVQVRLEFKTEGKLKNFARVELRITAGKGPLVSAPLLTSRPRPGIVAARFSAGPAYLAESTLMIVVQDGPMSRVGYQLKVKDFIDLEEFLATPPEQ